jgi:hypothetical protein
MIEMPELPVEARRQIVEMDADTLVEFFDVCIAQDHLAVADYILNTLYDTLDLATQQRIYSIFQKGADRALNEAVNGCAMQ